MTKVMITGARKGSVVLRTILILLLILILALATVINTAAPALADTSVARDPGTGADTTGSGGTITWSHPTYIQFPAAPSTTAVVTPSSKTHYLNATNYSFSIPSDATINGITVTIRRASGSGYSNNIRDSEVKLVKGGAIQATNYAITTTDWPAGTFETATYGGAADLWLNSWTPADINNANFGVVLAITNLNTTNSKTASVDYIRITVTYTLAELVISTSSPLPNGKVGMAYSQTLTATGGTPPYTWTISSGTLPAGLSLTAGVISGTPTTAASTTSPTFRVTDSASPAVVTTKALSITIDKIPWLDTVTITGTVHAVIDVTAPADFSMTLTPGVTCTSAAQSVTVKCNKAGWTLAVSGTNGGYMNNPSYGNLTNPLYLAGRDISDYQPLTSPRYLENGSSGAGVGTTTISGITFQQTPTWSDPAGDYTITITFTGTTN